MKRLPFPAQGPRSMIDRRSCLALLGASLAPWPVRALDADAASAPLALGAAWRGAGRDDAQQLGVLDVDWAARRIAVRYAVALPSRAHGLLAEPEGCLLAVAMRPGRWLLRCDANGTVMRRLSIDDESGGHRFDGHVAASADGAHLYTTQTDPAGRGWVALRERESLRKLDQWSTRGVDPHHLVLDADGHLMLANGGILRTPDGHKRELERMASSLVRLDARNGELLGQWTLADPRLSLRHLAWSRPAQGEAVVLGIGLQAEHDDPAQRAQAPLLALWDGTALQVAQVPAGAAGYAGDIAPASAGAFALSAQRAQRGLLWSPGMTPAWQRFAEIQEPCALAAPRSGADAGAVLLAGGAGIARWHPTQAPAMLRWPQPMALDNHWVVWA